MLLYDFFKDGPNAFEDISQYLDAAREHPTGRLWVDSLIRPTLIAHQFQRAERDCDYRLQQHYYRQIQVIEMQHMLPDDAKMDLLAGAHVCRHRPGTWSSVSADQFGEQTYIKKGKMPGGLKGLTMSEDQVAIWEESYPVCAHVTLAIESMYSADDEMKEETDANLAYHILRAHYQVMLWKAAYQQTPPAVDIAAYGWELVSGAGCVPTPRIARGPAAPPALMDVINCQCKAVGKACISRACSCHSAGLSCTPYCYCVGEAMCFNPFTKHDENEVRHDNEDEGDSTEAEGS